MLTSLKIENVAIIESAAIEFGCGLNVLTGETGAGKSIVIDSINAVLGERTSKDIIRTGADCAKVYAVFEDISDNVVSLLEETGVDCEDNVLIINRVINRDGKNTCRINGMPVTVNMLKFIAKELINVHGQHDNQALLSPDKHCSFIDKFADNSDLIEQYKESYDKLCEIRSRLKSMKSDESNKAQKIDLLTYQIDELEKAQIRVGEKDELNDRLTVINNSLKIISSLNNAYELLKRDQGGIDSVSGASYELSKSSEYLSTVSELSEKLCDIQYELDDIAETISDLLSDMDFSDDELDEISMRLDLLHKLSLKYGDTEEDMLEYLEKARTELENITFSEEKLLELKKLEATLYSQTKALADKLSEVRVGAGERLSGMISDELGFLDMPNVTFRVNRVETELTENGQDDIEFLISANAGEIPKPLAKIASGGELSRIMLAIKNVLADADDIATMIFDEIDTGVSGRAAHKIALKLREVSEGRQVLCVTHLAQIAAQGDVHFYISKSVSDGKTYTKIRSLVSDERVSEIARIMGGIEITELQLQSAREMLENAGNY